MLRNVIKKIPGFRTGVIWKKIIACVLYFLLITFIVILVVGSSSSISALDNAISKWESFSLIIFLIVAPFILISNLGNIRSKLPLFRSDKLIRKILAWSISIIIIIVGFALTNSYLGSKHSPEYIAYQQRLSEERASEKEAAKKAQLAEEAKERDMKKLAEEKTKMEDEKKTQIIQGKEKKTALIESDQQSVSASEQEPIQESKEKKSSKTDSFSSWFSGLFGSSKANDNATQEIIKTFERNLEKKKTEKILEIYNLSDEQIKSYIEKRINEEYLKEMKANKELLLSMKFDKIENFYKQVEFIIEIPKLNNSEVGKAVSEIKGLIEANNALAEFEQNNPQINYGIIKDSSEIQDIECYVNYRIKNSGTKIGDITIKNDVYTDMFLISSYTYNKLLGYTSTDDWKAVLKLKSDSKITQAGVYKTKVVSIGTTELIDSNGFSNEYPVFREISQQDIDKYNQVKNLIDKKNELNDAIDNSMNKISALL